MPTTTKNTKKTSEKKKTTKSKSSGTSANAKKSSKKIIVATSSSKQQKQSVKSKSVTVKKTESALEVQSSETGEKISDSKLRIYPLGGNEEVGRNMTVFEWGNDIVILDMGLQFPEEDTLGVDYIIPNIESLKGKEKNIRGVILTHGHLDHIGAVPYLLPKLGNPTVIGSDFTLALVKKRNEEFKENTAINTITIKKEWEKIKLGKFTINFFSVAHSIREAFGVVIETDFVNIIHLGDWRYDLDPVEGDPTDYTHLAKWNTPQKPALLAFESLGAIHEGHQGSEREVYETTKKIIEEAPGRVIFGTFSSMLERIGQVMEISEKNGRKVAIMGYSMKSAVEIGKKFGYINVKQSTIIDIKDIDNYPPKKITIIATGSQADERSALVRIANKENPYVRIQPDDTVVFSSSVIPGNERSIQRLKDSLYRQGANVIHKEIMDTIHAGGHAKQEDIKLLLKQVKPTYVMPVYANYYILKEAEKLVISQGWPKENVFVLDNGQILEFTSKGPKVLKKKVPTDYVFVDGLGIGDITNIVLRDRQLLSQYGMIIVVAAIRKYDGKLVRNPDILSRGFTYLKGNKDLIEAIRKKVKTVVMKNYDPRTPAQTMYLKNKIRSELTQFVVKKTHRRPIIMPVVLEV